MRYLLLPVALLGVALLVVLLLLGYLFADDDFGSF
jgi:hypothetical protein